MYSRFGQFIDGNWQQSEKKETYDVINPATEEVIGKVSKASVADVDKAKRFYGIRGERLYSIQNCAAATENILLMAHALGLGGAWIGYMEEDKIIPMLTIPQGLRPQAVIAIGYPAENPPIPPKYTLENSMYFRQFGGQPNRIKDIPQYKGEFSYKIKGAIDKTKEVAQKMNDKLMGKD